MAMKNEYDAMMSVLNEHFLDVGSLDKAQRLRSSMSGGTFFSSAPSLMTVDAAAAMMEAKYPRNRVSAPGLRR